MLDHRNLIEITKLLEEDLKSFSGSRKEDLPEKSEDSFCEVVRKGKYMNFKSLGEWPNLPYTPITLNNKYKVLSTKKSEECINHTEDNILGSRFRNKNDAKQITNTATKTSTVHTKFFAQQENKSENFTPKKFIFFLIVVAEISMKLYNHWFQNLMCLLMSVLELQLPTS
ncbi:hypothetical protein J6590_108594 [Homalodisca vitripennis]|nr:hypothetical protein J6590_108594 [Homalodisca vitripennis]